MTKHGEWLLEEWMEGPPEDEPFEAGHIEITRWHHHGYWDSILYVAGNEGAAMEAAQEIVSILNRAARPSTAPTGTRGDLQAGMVPARILVADLSGEGDLVYWRSDQGDPPVRDGLDWVEFRRVGR